MIDDTDHLHDVGYRALAVRLLTGAVRDAKRGDVQARAWLLADPLAQSIADVLGLERSAVLRTVAGSTAGDDGR